MDTGKPNLNSFRYYKYSFFRIVFLVFILYTFRTPIVDVLNIVLINPILSKVTSSVINDILITLISFIIGSYVYRKADERLQIRIAIIITTFSLINRFANSWEYTSYSIIDSMAYGDFIALAMICPGLIQLMKSIYKSFFKVKNIGKINTDSRDTYEFLEDNPVTDDIGDTFQRMSTAKAIAHSITVTNNEKSFAIGIIGEYGSGKTSFLNLIGKCLKENITPPLLLNFSPWSFEGSKYIQKEFFDLLIDKLVELDSRLTPLLYAYSRKLNNKDEVIDKVINRIHLINHLYNKDYSLNDYERINGLLKTAKRKVVIVIDDLDRLHADEVVEVLRIIRNTANFANVFYVVAYDKTYVLESIRSINTKGYLSYLDKIFQLEIPLPKREDKNLYELLRTNLKPILADSHYTEIKEDILPSHFESNYGKSLKDIFRNARDIVKFVNSFSITYQLIQENILFRDMFFNEVLKYRYPLVYDLVYERVDDFLYRKPYSAIYREYYIIRAVDSETNAAPLLIKYLESQEDDLYSKKDLELIHIIFKILYPENTHTLFDHAVNSIANPAYFDIYYRNRLTNFDLSEASYQAALKVGLTGIIKYIDDCLAKNLYKQILVRLLREDKFKDQEHFEVIISAIFYLGPKYMKEKGFTSFPSFDFIKLIADSHGNIIEGIYKGNKNNYELFIKELLYDCARPPFIFQNEIIYKIKENYPNIFVLSPEELTGYQIGYFSRLSDSGHGLSEEAVWLFWGVRNFHKISRNEESSYEDGWFFEPKVIPILKDRLKNKNLLYFLKYSIGKNIYSEKEFYIQSKILKEVFSSPAEFKEVISSNNYTDRDVLNEFLELFDKHAQVDFKQPVEFNFKTELKPEK